MPKCKICELPETFNKSNQIDLDGVCGYCDSYSNKLIPPSQNSEKQLVQILNKFKTKEKKRYDCLLALSGGRDSDYLLHLLKVKYKLNPLTVTLQKSIVPEEDIANIEKITKKLKVNHIWYEPREDLNHYYQKIIQDALNQKIDCKESLCSGCYLFRKKQLIKIAQDYKIPLIMTGRVLFQSLRQLATKANTSSPFSAKDVLTEEDARILEHYNATDFYPPLDIQHAAFDQKDTLNQLYKLAPQKNELIPRLIFPYSMIPYDLNKADKVLKSRYNLSFTSRSNCKLIEKSRLVNYINGISPVVQKEHHKLRTGEITKADFSKRQKRISGRILNNQRRVLEYLQNNFNLSIPKKSFTKLQKAQKTMFLRRFKKQALNQSLQVARQSKGQTRDWIFDVRRFVLDIENIDLFFETFWHLYKDKYPFQVCGETLSGAIAAHLISIKAKEVGFDINCFLVREERKKTGLQKKVEGRIRKDLPIVIIDDLFNSGGTITYLLKILKERQVKLDSLCVFVDYETERGKDFLKKHNLQLQSFFKLADFDINLPKQSLLKNLLEPELVWQFKASQPSLCYLVPKSTPCQDEDSLYFGTDSGVFYALHKKDGSVKWQFKTGEHVQKKGIFSCPVLFNQKVYFGSYDGNLYALDCETGKEKWKYFEADWIGSSPCFSKKDNLIFVGLEFGLPNRKGGIVALNSETGEKVWEDFFEDYVHCSPAYSEELDVVVIGSNCGYVRLYDAQTGDLYWEKEIGAAIKSSFEFDTERGILCFGSFDGKEYGLNLATGKVAFTYQTQGLIYSAPLLKDNLLFFTSADKNIYGLDLDTKQIDYKFLTSAKIFSTPSAWNQYIVFGSNDGRVYFFDFAKNKVGYIQFAERITNKIIFDQKHCYVSLYNNEIYCLNLNSIKKQLKSSW